MKSRRLGKGGWWFQPWDLDAWGCRIFTRDAMTMNRSLPCTAQSI